MNHLSSVYTLLMLIKAFAIMDTEATVRDYLYIMTIIKK